MCNLYRNQSWNFSAVKTVNGEKIYDHSPESRNLPEIGVRRGARPCEGDKMGEVCGLPLPGLRAITAYLGRTAPVVSCRRSRPGWPRARGRWRRQGVRPRREGARDPKAVRGHHQCFAWPRPSFVKAVVALARPSRPDDDVAAPRRPRRRLIPTC
jgi:hypothetical protein